MVSTDEQTQGSQRDTLPDEAVIFDMDGVIVDSEPYHTSAFKEICARAGVDHTLGPSFESYIGRSDAEFWSIFIREHKLNLTVPQIRQMKRDCVLERFRRELPFFPGLHDLVECLAPIYRLAIASGSEKELVEAVLEFGGLTSFFRIRVTSSEVPIGKPEPDIFLRAAALLKVPPAACWVIEDSKPGVAAALAAGMRVIAVTNTHTDKELSNATHVVNSCAEIEHILLPRAASGESATAGP